MYPNLPAAESIFCSAIDIESDDARAAYVDQACAADGVLLQQVGMLLRAHFGGGSFLDTPAVWTTLPAPAAAECAGTLIGPYKLLEQIGEGGMGIVYLAEQQQPVRRRVALKIIKPGMDSRQVIARFEAERQALALMEHPHIARVLDAGTTEAGRPYFVMELVRGTPITDYCDQSRQPIPERLRLFIAVCRAVQHAHQKGIIHRDLKPSNILVTLDDAGPVAKVIDFGIAKATGQKLTEHTLHTGFAQMMGTPAYMSPEQAELSGLDIDTRSDIYSLGVLLYELLTGSPPFERDTLRQGGLDAFRRLVREVEPILPSSRIEALTGESLMSVADHRASEQRKLGQIVRGELDWLVMKALKDRNRRYETASGFAADVERYLNHEPVQACPPSAAYRMRKFVRRNKSAVVAATLIVLALAGGITGTSIGLVRARSAQGLALARLGDLETANAQTTEALKDAQEAKRKASDEAAIARAVSDFLTRDLLGQVSLQYQSGAQERDPDLRVRTLLDRASRNIEGKFKDQPLTEAAIRFTLGTVYHELGLFGEAQTNLERSAALRDGRLGPDHPDTLESKNQLASVCFHALHRYDRAEALLKEVIASKTATLGPDHAATQHDKSFLGLVYSHQGKIDLAEPLLVGAVEKHTATLGPNDAYTMHSKHNLAWFYMHQRKYDLAEGLYREVVAGRLAIFGADHPDTLLAHLHLAQCYSNQDKDELADRVYQEMLAMPVVKRGPDHPIVISFKYSAGLFYHTRGKSKLAMPLFKEVLESAAARHHPDDHEIQGSQALLEANLASQDKEFTERFYKELIDKQTTKVGADHHCTLKTKFLLAAFYHRHGKDDLAEPLCLSIFASHRRGTDQGADPARWSILNSDFAVLGELLQEFHRNSEAEAIYRQGVEVAMRLVAQVPAKDYYWYQHRDSLRRLGNLLVTARRFEEAEQLLLAGYERMLQCQATIPPSAKSCVTDALQQLVELYDGWGKPDEAAKWREELKRRQRPA